MSVVLRPVAGTVDQFDVGADGTGIGHAHMVVTGTTAHCSVQLHRAPAVDRDIFNLVVALVEQAEMNGVTEVVLETDSLLLRDAARWAGFGGGLRVPLRADVADIGGPGPHGDGARAPGRRERLASLVARLDSMGIVSTPTRQARVVGRLSKKLAGGAGDTMEVTIAWAPGRTFTVSVPDRPDLMPEPVALAADTTVGVLHRFPDQAAGVTLVSFDQALHEMKTGIVAGMTAGSSQAIHLNISYVTVEALLETMRGSDGPPRPSRSARPPAPYTAVEATTAHELWHRIEMVFEARDYRSSIEFRRLLGHHLGVETLEQALKGGTPRAPGPWQVAHRRLVAEVSDYATTNAREATAEMFKLWWCRAGATTPVVTRFGELVDQFFVSSPDSV